MKPPPRVSVVIPAYNAGAYLHEALDSVLAQTMTDWAAVVVDDGSTDETLAVAESYACRDRRIQVVRQPNRGVSSARNTGMSVCPGEYFAFLDADDIWRPQKLERQLGTAQQQQVGLVYCSREWFMDNGEAGISSLGQTAGFMSNDRLLRAIAGHSFFMPSCAMVKGDLLEQVGRFDESLRVAEDWDLWWRIALAGEPAFGLEDPLYRHRCTGSGLSSNWSDIFWSSMTVAGRYHALGGLSQRQSRKAFRLLARNGITRAGSHGCYNQLFSMFDTYRSYDADGYACQVMAVLRHVLPPRAFWMVSRYLVIPLAWHLERFGEKRFQ